MKLPYHPLPFADESKRGFCWRFSLRNGFSSPASLERILTSKLGRKTTVDDVILDVCGAEASSLISGIEERCSSRFVLKSTFRACRTCMDINPYLRDEWEYALLPHCTCHGCRLMDIGPTPENFLLRSCMRLPGLSRRPTEGPAPRKCIERLIATSLGFADSHVSGLDMPLADLSTDELQKTVLLFASHELFEDRFQPQKAPFKSDIDIATQIVDTAEVIFGNWPKSFREHVHGTFTKNSRSLKREIGYLYEAVHTELLGSQFIPIRSEFDGSLRDAWPEPVLNDRSHLKLLPAMLPKKESGTLFCKRNKVKLESVISWVDSGLLSGNVRVLPSGHRQVSVGCGQSPPERSKPVEVSLNLIEASGRLGVPKRCMRAMAEKGLFDAVRDPATRVWRISEQAISETLSMVSSAISTGGLDDGLDIYRAVRYFLPSTHGMGRLVEAIINREIAYTTVRNAGVASMVDVRLEKVHLKQWVIGDDALSITEFAEARHLHQEFTYQIVRKGLLETEHLGRCGTVIRLEAAREFDTSYVTGSSLLPGSSFKRTKELLDFLLNRGVYPVMGPKADGSRQYLFRRSSLCNIDL